MNHPDEWGSPKTQVQTQDDKDRAAFVEEERQREQDLLREDAELQAALKEERDRKANNWYAAIPAWAMDKYMVLSDPAKRLIVSLAMRRNKKSGLSFPGMARIMKDTKLARRAVFRAFKELVDAGLVEKAEGLDGKAFRGHSPHWSVFNPATKTKATVKGAKE